MFQSPPPLCDFEQWIDTEISQEDKEWVETLKRLDAEREEQMERRRKEEAAKKEREAEIQMRRQAKAREVRERKLERVRVRRAKAALERVWVM